MIRTTAVLFISFNLAFSACSLPPTKVKVPAPPSAESGASQTGIASWYGPGFHGRPTASGAIYNQNELTAAHQTLPLGTRVMVTNLDNGRSTEVAINDRGPFAKGRILDLSYAAARTLGMIGPGTIPVRIEVIDSGPYKIQSIRQSLDYTLQAGSFIGLDNAQRLKERLVNIYPQVPEVSIVSVHGKDTIYYRVQMGSFASRRDAEGHARQLARKGFPIIIMEK
ncbi:MAG: septal ring lytic transglycosylase RlpA family protein [Deltaproteobacteria bacterium]|nr:septal ring lytic transglycosylase RlpA family protein [Deltaproteobacteria bacterium]